MQRLFSSFADGWPGAGLLLLRLMAGEWPALWRSYFGAIRPYRAVAPPVLAAGAGDLLFVGLVHAFSGSCGGHRRGLDCPSPTPGNRWPPIGLDGLTLSLAMIGPGAWSTDARLFGRKQIDPSNFERESDRARKW